MMENAGKYIDLVIQKATWKKGIFLSLIAGFFFILINFTDVGIAGLLKITGGANILDAEFGYNQETAHRILTELGIRGREFYQNKIVPIDFLFPIFYMLFFVVWTALLLKFIKFNNCYRYIIFLPFFAMLFDWIENTGIIVMLKNYPDLPLWACFVSSTSGILKFLFALMSVVNIILLIIIFMIKKVKRTT